MNNISEKLISLFPEIKTHVFTGDEELPHVMMSHVADLVKKTFNEKNEGNQEYQSIISRIIELRDWCINNEDDSDAYTVYIISLYETICESQKTHPLIPFITEKEDFLNNEEYLTAWIGAENYDQILKDWNRRSIKSR